MLYEFKLPDIGEGVVEGEVVRWLVAEGDLVREDQPLVEVMTDKATVEIPAPRAGRVAQRLFAEGQVCPVGRVLITIDTDAAEPAGLAPARAAGAAAGVGVAPAATVGVAGVGPLAVAGATAPAAHLAGAVRAPVLATPATRKLARTLGIDIRQITGNGRAGRITSDDVRAAAHGDAMPVGARLAGVTSGAGLVAGAGASGSSSLPSKPLAVSSIRPSSMGAGTGALGAGGHDVRIPFRGVRKKIAEHLVHSKHTAAHFTYVEEVDVSDLVALRDKANQRLAARDVKLSFLPFFIKATAGALARFPQLNATLDEAAGEIVQHAARHIGLATATDSGLIVPVIRNADQRTLVELAGEIRRLSDATRAGKATREELSGSTFTITSLGALGGLLATPIINFPEAAILGIHKIAKRPMADGKRVVVRDMMNLSISVDHRIVDGHEAARFVAEIKTTLENPGLMFLDSI
jgi:pyruvate dehydrogenase E2 component (dihydrolipoamide acetyltransferase)